MSSQYRPFDAEVMRQTLAVVHEIALDVSALVQLPSVASTGYGPDLLRHAESLVRRTRPYAVRPPQPPEAA